MMKLFGAYDGKSCEGEPKSVWVNLGHIVSIGHVDGDVWQLTTPMTQFFIKYKDGDGYSQVIDTVALINHGYNVNITEVVTEQV